jgi:hypothetical protein
MIALGILAVIILACFGLITFIGAPYVPTHKRQITKVLDETKLITADDLVVDLGSGDGVLLRAVAKRGGRALGFELNPILWALSVLLSGRYAGRVQVRCRNFWTAKLPSETTIVYVFLDSRFIPRLRRKLERHVARTGRPIRLLSYGFEVPGAQPDAEIGGMLLYTIHPK